MRSTTRSPPAAWRRSTSAACVDPRASRARWRSSACTRSSCGIRTSWRCSSTRRGWPRAFAARTWSPRWTSCPRAASSPSSWSTSTASRSGRSPYGGPTSKRSGDTPRRRTSRSPSPSRSWATCSKGCTRRTSLATSKASRSESFIATSRRRTSSWAPTVWGTSSTSEWRRLRGGCRRRETDSSRESSRTWRPSSSAASRSHAAATSSRRRSFFGRSSWARACSGRATKARR